MKRYRNFSMSLILVLVMAVALSGCLPQTTAAISGPGWQYVAKVVSSKGVETKSLQDTTWAPQEYASQLGELPLPNSKTTLWLYFKDKGHTYALAFDDAKEWLSFQAKVGCSYSFYYNTNILSKERFVEKASLKEISCDP